MTDEINEMLIAISDEFRLKFNGDEDDNSPIKVVVANNKESVLTNSLPLIVIQDLGADEDVRFLGDQTHSGRGKILAHRFQCDIYIDDASVWAGETAYREASLLRYMLTKASETIEQMGQGLMVAFSGVDFCVVDVNNQSFTDISFVEEDRLYHGVADINVTYIKNW